ESMGGKLEIDSIKGKGTIVRFKLGLLKSEHTHHADTDMTVVQGKRILLVEDNVTLSNSLNEEIIRWGLTSAVAKSGAEALDILTKDGTFDLIVVEMQMPDMDGMKLSQEIRQSYPSIPIILLTSASDEESKKQPELFSSIVLKPVKYHILAQHIQSALMQKEQGRPGESNHATQKLSHDFAKKYPLRILVAEDNRVNQKLAIKVLSKLGYDPDIAQDGKEVLEEVDKVNYDLIFMDVQMPEMDGLEATRMIRLCLSVQPVIIAMTANAMQGDREECMQAGMDDYLSKPVRVEELVIVLEKWSLKMQEK
ncbi:MAG: histidine kinase, partial [Marivirga sp.]|nr:histidine kinase [Marivirga sp.]